MSIGCGLRRDMEISIIFREGWNKNFKISNSIKIEILLKKIFIFKKQFNNVLN